MSDKRWKVVIRYYPENMEHQLIYIEELDELQDIVESGPDFRLISKIEITYNLNKPKPNQEIETIIEYKQWLSEFVND